MIALSLQPQNIHYFPLESKIQPLIKKNLIISYLPRDNPEKKSISYD